MSDRAELFEATLEGFPEGIALLGEDLRVLFWNHAAQVILGYTAPDMVGRPAGDALQPFLECQCTDAETDGGYQAGHERARGFSVHTQHKLGFEVCTTARVLPLRNDLGARIGTAVLFHPSDSVDGLPHGVTGESEDIEASQVDLEERLASSFDEFMGGGPAFGVLWITVDQAQELRKTHGRGACDAMLEKIERVLSHGLRPAEHMGRWGEDEFLVVSHERTSTLLGEHAKVLTGLARTTDFRWWGDRVSLTVSIGVAQAEITCTLANLLERAKAAMISSFHAGGNQITRAPEGNKCSPL
jgi:diguanylate cyclase (GGDEF)-like protein/PAS domain S-box-containing protein